MRTVRLGDLCDIRIGRTPSRANSEFWGGPIPWAAISDLGQPVVTETREGVTELAIRLTRMRAVEPGTLLYSFKLTIGKMAVAGRQLYTNEAIAALVPRDPSALDAAYLRLALMTVDGGADSSIAVMGRTLNSSSLADLPVPMTSIDQQRRIAAQLTDQLAAVDRAREGSHERGRSIGLVRARTYEAAFRGVVPLAVENPADPAPEPWRWHLLTDLARLESGHTPSRSRPDWWGGDIPWIALPDIRAVDGQVIDDTAEHTNPEGIAHSAARVLPAETVVMSRTASVGFVARMGRPAATSQDFVNWVCGPDLDPEFLMHLLIRSRDYIRGLSSGAIHKTVYFPTVKAFRVCVPPITEQRRIALELRERLATVDTMTKSIQAELEAIEALPAALLRRAFDEG